MKRSWFEKVELGKVKVCCSDNDSLKINNIENLANVPFTNNKFKLSAKKIVKSNTEIVFLKLATLTLMILVNL